MDIKRQPWYSYSKGRQLLIRLRGFEVPVLVALERQDARVRFERP